MYKMNIQFVYKQRSNIYHIRTYRPILLLNVYADFIETLFVYQRKRLLLFQKDGDVKDWCSTASLVYCASFSTSAKATVNVDVLIACSRSVILDSIRTELFVTIAEIIHIADNIW